VLHDTRQRERERLGETAHRQTVLASKSRENGAPRRIGEGRKGEIELGVGLSIVNHMVKYRDRPSKLSIHKNGTYAARVHAAPGNGG